MWFKIIMIFNNFVKYHINQVNTHLQLYIHVTYMNIRTETLITFENAFYIRKEQRASYHTQNTMEEIRITNISLLLSQMQTSLRKKYVM